MNANELADNLEYLYQQDDADGIQMPVFLYSATMLRQQQARIEALEASVKFWVAMAEKERVRADRNEQ